ncbi:luciferase [Mycolicibacterium moriokaense]|jgi:alkanesulfonate monooxygenase SsuD/methylene tetrahydromethanopterin reductase-like flavin-dependent oxidoreductase (luciferase family)|uniref:Luciferase n=1 Tax=Mycolicibacterium moriokaense TaxID=39691 RepID=A0AAD1H6Y3_9MYCO|nr:LLM class flavin-dependent oxidoreductase [Mycolicibacterium moriokaense]MCV7039067.1 LLM class flavin-dependent oxidoreductase [Mycolicibacterium moriokaense]ORB20347.1 luciferase [Mycolicibacterium moriokaense]BBW99967.1 luciferase [Mycolicibacterium moriokaense]
MRVGLLQEGDLTGTNAYERYHQLIEEVALADELGFSTWGTSEQHFSPPNFSVAAPEVLYSAIAMRTKNIKLRIMAAVMLKWNHPILVAERMATLDIVSHGRAELCTARSNNLTTLGAFGVDPATTREQWEDGMAVLLKAMTADKLEHDGPIWKIPPVEVVPKPYTKPHLPLSVAASSVQTHTIAGERGIGVVTFDNYFGFDYLQECMDAYLTAFDSADHSNVLAPNDFRGLFVATAFCAEDRKQAREIAREKAMGYFKFILDLYIPLSKQPGYTYLETLDQLIAHQDDLDWLCEYTPSVMIGTPGDFIERLRRLEEIGVDEVVLRIDGVGHENIKRSLELIGHEVIPAVR